MALLARGAEKRRISLVQVHKPPPVLDVSPDRASVLWDRVERCVRDRIRLEDEFQDLRSSENWSTLLAIRAQVVQTEVKKTTHWHKSKSDTYVNRFRNGESALAIARSVGYPPFLLIKILLPILEPDLLKRKITIENIKDARLRREFKDCEDADQDYAPCMDRIRQTIGDEYEFKLQRELRSLGAIFLHEDDLRESGHRKTPDALLSIPLAVDLEKVMMNDPWVRRQEEPLQRQHHIVRWIDSKAMFGSYNTHCVANKEQLQSYVARFGPGMVVYWFGFDFHAESALHEVLLVSRFPADAVLML